MTPLPERLEELFTKYTKTQISFRKATIDDAAWLLFLRNDQQTRAQSLTQEPISPEQHIHWLKNTLINPSRLLLIASFQENKVASFRLDQKADGSIELSWTVAPDFRGKGMGSLLLTTVGAILPGHLELCACVLQGNPASLKMAEKAGLRPHRKEGQLIWLKRAPDPLSNDA